MPDPTPNPADVANAGQALDNDERLRRWRLVLGGGAADGVGITLVDRDLVMDRAMTALYDDSGTTAAGRQGRLGASAPNVARWLGDIRTYFPASVVRVMQKDAIDRLGLQQMLTEPELLESIEPDVHLVSTLMSLGRVLPERTRDTARMVIRRVVEDLTRRLAQPTREAIRGALNRSSRTNRPRHSEIDWHRTIRVNLKHYQPEYRTIVPERRIGYGRRRTAMKHVVLAVDQSGSMSTSVVYAGIFSGVLASLPALRTRVVAFDTAVVDLTEMCSDPVDLLFGIQLGGGTDINRAVGYCQTLIERPSDTIFVLITDLYEGGNASEFLQRAARLVASGVRCVVLLALNDEGAPSYDREMAAKLTALGIPCFACTPDRFPELMAAALERRDLASFLQESPKRK